MYWNLGWATTTVSLILRESFRGLQMHQNYKEVRYFALNILNQDW